MVFSQTVAMRSGLGGDGDALVTALQFQTSCFQTSHERQHSVRYASCSGSGEATCAAAPCDFN